MRSTVTAVTAVILAVAWLATVALDSPPMIGLVTVAALAMPALLAPRKRLRALVTGAVGIASAIAATLVTAVAIPDGVTTLAAMMASAAVAAVVLPLLYAATFDDDSPEPP